MIKPWVAAALLVFGSAVNAGTITPVDADQFKAALDTRKGQIVLVNFWATWCRPCLKELPELTALASGYRERGVRLVAVSLDEPNDLAGIVKPFLKDKFPELDTLTRATPDMDGLVSVLDQAWNEVLPTSYVLDRTGRVRTKIQGGRPIAEFEAAVEKLLAE